LTQRRSQWAPHVPRELEPDPVALPVDGDEVAAAEAGQPAEVEAVQVGLDLLLGRAHGRGGLADGGAGPFEQPRNEDEHAGSVVDGGHAGSSRCASTIAVRAVRVASTASGGEVTTPRSPSSQASSTTTSSG